MTTAEGWRAPKQRAAPTPDGIGHVQLLLLARALGLALTAAEVAEAVFEHAVQHLGASSVGLWRLDDDDMIRFAGGAGREGLGGVHEVGEIPVDSDLPAAAALREGRVISYGSDAERNARWPSLSQLAESLSQAVVVVPLTARGRRRGCLHIGWPEPRESFEPDADLTSAVGELCATALDRALLYEAERNAHEVLEFLNEGTRLMVSALDPDEIVQSLVALAVPRLAPWCAVYVADNDALVRVAIEISTDPGLARELRATGPVPLDADVPLATVYRTGETMVLEQIPAEMVARTYRPDHARKVLALTTDGWAGLVVPVRVAGRVIGVMSLLSPVWARRPPPEVHYAAEGLAARAGVALHNAQRYGEQVDNVRLLTAALLPGGVPVIAGLRLAARYMPASGGVCGDWYEVDSMPDGRVLLGIGDASGHGIDAAATMARVRHAARGLAEAGIPPASMMDHLSRLLTGDARDSIATTIYGLVDPATGTGLWSSAGHPPPIMIQPDHTVGCVGLAPGPPIGAIGPHEQVSLELGRGGRLVLYTDGLFERRGEDLDVGISRLVSLIDGMPDASVDEIADAVMATRGDIDDACVLVIGR